MLASFAQEGAEGKDLAFAVEVLTLSKLDHPLEPNVREARLLTDAPWVRSLGRLDLSVTTEGWKFPAPPAEYQAPPPRPEKDPQVGRQSLPLPALPDHQEAPKPRIRPKPTADTVLFKDRLLYLLQPPLDGLFDGRQLEVPFEPYPYQLEGIAFLMPRHHAMLADEMGLGKAQPLDANVLTPTGWKRMGDVRVGDEVVNSAGASSRVIGVYPQGTKPVFRVTFSDGSSTECCDDHLWEVNTPLRNWRGNPPRVLPLREIREQLARPSGNRLHFIRLVKPVQFPPVAHSVDPYLLGLLLGDGNLSQGRVRFSTTDPELAEAVAARLPDGLQLRKASGPNCDFRIGSTAAGVPNALIRRLCALGLMGTRSESKFIPTPTSLRRWKTGSRFCKGCSTRTAACGPITTSSTAPFLRGWPPTCGSWFSRSAALPVCGRNARSGNCHTA